MKYLLIIPPEVEESIAHFHPLLKRKVRYALQEIQEDPLLGKPLKGPLEGLRSYRVTRYRIVYRVVRRKVLVEVIDIGPREMIYERILQILRLRPFLYNRNFL